MSEKLKLQLDGKNRLSLNLKPEDQLSLKMSGGVGTMNYERLYNKPKINLVELSGNISFSDLLPNGIIIDGGDATNV